MWATWSLLFFVSFHFSFIFFLFDFLLLLLFIYLFLVEYNYVRSMVRKSVKSIDYQE
jgi:hypothetical protein